MKKKQNFIADCSNDYGLYIAYWRTAKCSGGGWTGMRGWIIFDK